MALRVASYSDLQSMPGFEREYFYKELSELFTDKKSGKIVL